MPNLITHPQSGYHYIIVIPDMWGPFVDYYAGYQVLAQQFPWISVISDRSFPGWLKTFKDDSSIFFVLWDEQLPAPKPHKCIVTAVYKEAIDDDPSKMLPDHIDHWHRVGKVAPGYDAFFVHTPRMAAPLHRGMSLPTFVLPAGWSPEAMGVPRNKHIHHELVYWGSFAGRRKTIIPQLKNQLGSTLLDASGSFGRTLIGIIENTRAALYVAHSNVWSFSTWRLWQGLAAGTPHIAEPGDSWPFVAGKHYIPFTPFSESEEVNRTSIDFISNVIREDVWLQGVADSAYADLADNFTLQRCVEDYLVPASLQLREMPRE